MKSRVTTRRSSPTTTSALIRTCCPVASSSCSDGVNVLRSKYHSYFHTPGFPHDIRVDDSFYGASLRARF